MEADNKCQKTFKSYPKGLKIFTIGALIYALVLFGAYILSIIRILRGEAPLSFVDLGVGMVIFILLTFIQYGLRRRIAR